VKRTREIQRAVADIRRQQRRGLSLDSAEIARRYGHLMPELAGRLRLLEEIQASARAACQPPSGAGAAAESAASAGDDLTILGQALPDYELLERINDGAQGVLYKARHRPSGRIAAVKVLLDGPLATELQQRRFQREIELVARLQHPFIVQLLDRGVVRGRLFFAMEYIDGLPIDDYAYAHDLRPRQIARLFGDVAEALHHAHQNGVIHRDLKPTNVLVDTAGRPHLLDFGLAKDAGPGAGRRLSTLTLAGQVFGTLPYLSPEEVVLDAGGTIDARADVYALGVMLFEVLTGSYPYPVGGRRELVRDNILFREPQSLRKVVARQGAQARLQPADLDGVLEAIVRMALRKDREERYPTADALAVDLRSYAAGRPVRAAAEGHLDGVRRLLRRYRIQVAVSAALAALALLAAAGWHRATTRAEQARRNAQVAYAALHRVVDDIEDSVRPLHSSIGTREALLRSVAADLQVLQDQAAGLGVADTITAELREKQGDLEALSGQDDAALAHYRAAVALRPAPAAGAEELIHQARLQRKIGTASANGLEHYDEALRVADTGLQAQPGHAGLELERIRICLARAQRLRDRSACPQALQDIASALALNPALPEAGPQQVELLRLRAQAHSLEGGCRLELGQQAGSVAALELALDLRRQLSGADPGDVELRHELMQSLLRVGDARRDSQDRPAAQAAYEQAIDIGTFLRGVDPYVVGWTRDLYAARDRLGRLLIEDDQLRAAVPHVQAAQDLARVLLEAEPQSPRWQRMLGFACMLSGRLDYARRRWQDAERNFERAVQLRRAAQDEAAGEYERAELATSLDWLGRCRDRLGMSEESMRCCREAHELRAQLLADHPDSTGRALDLVSSWISLAGWHQNRVTASDDQVARQYLDLAEERLEALRREGRLDATQLQYAECQATIQTNRRALDERRASGGPSKLVPAEPALFPGVVTSPPVDPR
jgi:tetratricopeptide (TPR) repeat protein